MTNNKRFKIVTNPFLKATAFSLVALSFSAQANLWEESKNAASSAWENTKEATSEAWDKTKEVSAETWDKTKEASGEVWKSTKETGVELKNEAKEKWDAAIESENKEESSGFGDIAKLADKETYVKAWQGIKESAANPASPNTDENGIPKDGE